MAYGPLGGTTCSTLCSLASTPRLAFFRCVGSIKAEITCLRSPLVNYCFFWIIKLQLAVFVVLIMTTIL